MGLKATEIARLMEAYAVTPTPARGHGGRAGFIRKYVEWVESVAPPYRAAALNIITQIIEHEKQLLASGWKEEAQARLDVCVNWDSDAADELDQTPENTVTPDDLARWANTPSDELEHDPAGTGFEALNEPPLNDPGDFPNFGALVNTGSQQEVKPEDAAEKSNEEEPA